MELEGLAEAWSLRGPLSPNEPYGNNTHGTQNFSRGQNSIFSLSCKVHDVARQPLGNVGIQALGSLSESFLLHEESFSISPYPNRKGSISHFPLNTNDFIPYIATL